ncbi:MAG TPA: HAD family hydrolase [Pirellulales bacterium]|jgi:HAD superfamily hydrolase (TIGR01509 family)
MDSKFSSVRGVIFDLDGTLVDSGLDFDLMRQEMELPPGSTLLEAIDQLDDARAAHCRDILARHEWAGADRARLLPGVREFLTRLTALGMPQAVLTRNARDVTLATLKRLSLVFDPIMTREDAPAKPDPTAIWRICEQWGLTPNEVAVIGDFHFDIEAGLRAGTRTVLYTAGREPSTVRGSADAGYCLHCFQQSEALLAWLLEPI